MATKNILYVFVHDADHRKLVEAHMKTRRPTDSGFDIVSRETDLRVKDYNSQGIEIKTGMTFAAVSQNSESCVNAPYLLLARSSTSLTPLRMSNQIGLADAGYRGELFARVDVVQPIGNYTIMEGKRLFQVVAHNWLPWNEVHIVDKLEDLPAATDDRGAGGCGSTGA
jgi:dUTPase